MQNECPCPSSFLPMATVKEENNRTSYLGALSCCKNKKESIASLLRDMPEYLEILFFFFFQ